VSDSLLGLLLADKDEKLKITSTGLKIFERHELRGKESGKCQYRIAQVGWPCQQSSCSPLTVPHNLLDDVGDDAGTVNNCCLCAGAVWAVRNEVGLEAKQPDKEVVHPGEIEPYSLCTCP
jgi:hypothetical protein